MAAWQQAQREAQHVPATHKQLLGLFGISPQAAMLVAALMSRRQLRRLICCWTTFVALQEPARLQGFSVTSADLRKWPQPSDLLRLDLLQPVVFYGAAYGRSETPTSCRNGQITATSQRTWLAHFTTNMSGKHLRPLPPATAAAAPHSSVQCLLL
jgi:hypothetical protein